MEVSGSVNDRLDKVSTQPGALSQAPQTGSTVEMPSETEAIPLPPSAPSTESESTAAPATATEHSRPTPTKVHHWNRAGAADPRNERVRAQTRTENAHHVRHRKSGTEKASQFSSLPQTPPPTVGWGRKYRAALRVTDILCVIAAVGLAHSYKLAFAGFEPEGTYLWISLGVIVLWILDLELGRSRELRLFGTGAAEYKAISHSAARVFVISTVLLIIAHGGVLRGFILIAFGAGLLMLLTNRWLWRKALVRRRRAGKSLNAAVVIGRFKDVEAVISLLNDQPEVGYRVAGVGLNSLPAQTTLSQPWYRIPVMSTVDDIEHLVSAAGASTVIVAGTLPGGAEQLQELGWQLEDLDTELVLASGLTNVAGPRVHFQPVAGMPLMHVELPQFTGARHVIKRLVDLILTGLAVIALAPVFLLLALAVRLDSRGPVFFAQERVGRNEKTFRMYKFRSMVHNADSMLAELHAQNEGAGPLFKMKNDPRITRTGRWMRRLSLDELPQLFNVLSGDMSLVGPRPPLKREVDSYERPTHRRLLIKPGITGLWQISGRSNLSWEESVRLDLYYVENWSLTGDLMIMWRTGKAMVSAEGAY